MQGSRNLLWFLPLLLLVASPVWWPSVVDFLQPRGGFFQAETVGGKERNFSMEKVIFTQTKKGEIDLEVKAALVLTSKGESVIELREIEAVIHDNDGRPVRITGGTAHYDTQKQALTVRDNVEVLSPEGYRLETESLSYFVKAGRIENDKPVFIQSKSVKASGAGFRLDLSSGDFYLDGRVKVLLQQ